MVSYAKLAATLAMLAAPLSGVVAQSMSSMSSMSASGMSSMSAMSTSGMSGSASSGSAAAASSSGSSSGTTPTFCAKYSQALFGDTSAAHETALVTAVVTTAVYGNQTSTPVVPGIVNANSPILQYFNGSVLYYRGGGPPYNYAATPTSRPFTTNTGILGQLASHLVQWFGRDLGCNLGNPYAGVYNMTFVHELMYINNASMTYFDNQLALTLLSFGVSLTDVQGLLPYLWSFQRGGASTWNICSQPDCSTAKDLGAAFTSDAQIPQAPSGSSSTGSAGGSAGGSSGGGAGGSSGGAGGGGGSGSTGSSGAINIAPAMSIVAALMGVLAMFL